MRSQCRNVLVTAFVLSLALTTADTARAQFVVPGLAGEPAIGSFGPAYGGVVAYGLSPVGYGPFGYGGGGYGIINPATGTGYGWGGVQTTHSYRSMSNAISLVPGWDGPSRRVRRRH
jgi:uncharacterized membrane protein